MTIPGDSEKEILISIYLCHPSMVNNELSGPIFATFLAKWISELVNRKYTYRIIIIPETIGSVIYLSRNYQSLQRNVIAGLNVTCIGDDLAYSYLPSQQANTFSDKATLHILKHMKPQFASHSFLDRGSDERQYCSPGIDLPVCSIMRTKYGCYPEYHTSLDNFQGRVSTDGPAWTDVSYEFYMRDLDRDTNWRRDKIAAFLKSHDVLHDNSCGDILLRWFDSTRMTPVIGAALRKELEFLFQIDQALLLQIKISTADMRND